MWPPVLLTQWLPPPLAVGGMYSPESPQETGVCTVGQSYDIQLSIPGQLTVGMKKASG